MDSFMGLFLWLLFGLVFALLELFAHPLVEGQNGEESADGCRDELQDLGEGWHQRHQRGDTGCCEQATRTGLVGIVHG